MHTEQNVGDGLPAIAVVQLQIQWLTRRLRGQARFHRGSVSGADSVAIHNQCGSWLACDGGGSVTDSVTDTPPSRASPLPQGSVPGADSVGIP